MASPTRSEPSGSKDGFAIRTRLRAENLLLLLAELRPRHDPLPLELAETLEPVELRVLRLTLLRGELLEGRSDSATGLGSRTPAALPHRLHPVPALGARELHQSLPPQRLQPDAGKRDQE